jgi:hypothetical protein
MRERVKFWRQAGDEGRPRHDRRTLPGWARTPGPRWCAEWLPSRNVCTYAVRWVAIKYRWSLAIDSIERRRLTHLLTGTCGNRTIALPPRGR